MKTIWKYPLEQVPSQVIEMPESNQPLSVQIVGDENLFTISLWVMVDSNRPKTSVTIEMYQTGENIPVNDYRQYIGTLQFLKGDFILHVFKKQH